MAMTDKYTAKGVVRRSKLYGKNVLIPAVGQCLPELALLAERRRSSGTHIFSHRKQYSFILLLFVALLF
jgi:hypothetical protein